MQTIQRAAAAILLLTSQAYAATTIAPNALTATPSGQSSGRQIFFKLPLVGDTKNCIITIAYGEKPGVGPNNDGDTHLNGQASLDRVRTYAADGTYTFTAKAKSGCTGEAKVTFKIGNGAPAGVAGNSGDRGGAVRPAGLPGLIPAAGLPAPVVVAANPVLVVAHTKITGMQVSDTSMQVGGSLTVKVNGTGAESQCPTSVLIAHNGNNYYKVSDKVATGAWPRTSVFKLTEPGPYMVSVYATEAAHLSPEERTACGFQYSYGSSGIPGTNTLVQVADIPK